jgi:hypothetical protein
MKTRILTLVALSLALTLTARAQVPGIINYQGRVSDDIRKEQGEFFLTLGCGCGLLRPCRNDEAGVSFAFPLTEAEGTLTFTESCGSRRKAVYQVAALPLHPFTNGVPLRQLVSCNTAGDNPGITANTCTQINQAFSRRPGYWWARSF